MKQYVTIDKRSKKAQKEYYTKLRGTWGELNPVTRSVPSGKTYNRNKDKQKIRKIGREFSDGFDVDFVIMEKTRDITADTAISNVITRDAIIACDFSGDVLDDVDRGEEFLKEAFLLRMMRNDYELFNQQLGILDKEEAEVFGQFLRKEKCIADIAEDRGLVYESVQQKLHRVKRKLKIQMVGFLDGNVGGV